MKKIFLSIPISLISLLICAQPSIQWQKSLGGTNTDQAYSIQQTANGGYIVAGVSISNDGDVFNNHGGSDIWVVRLDTNGAVLWKKTFGGSSDDRARSIQQTSDGGFVVVGHTVSNNGDVSGNHGDYDAWILKISSTGVIQWQRCLGGSAFDEAWDVQQSTDGGYIVIGGSSSSDGDLTFNNGSSDFWVVKMNGSGTIEWQKSLGGSGFDLGYAIRQTNDGGYIATGEGGSNNGDISGFHGVTDFWVVKLTFDGKIEWERSLGGTSLDRGNDIQPTQDGGYIVYGQIRSSNGDVTGYHGGYDLWAVKLNKDGAIEWQRALGGSGEDYATSIYQTEDDGYIMTGQTQSTDGDVNDNDGGADLWIVKLSDTGAILWEKTLGGTQDEWGNSIEQTSDGGFIMAGYARSNNGDVSENKGKTDYWIVKLSPESSFTSAPAPLPLEISPNPAQNTISLKVPSLDKDLNILVTDLLGRELQQRSIPNPQSGSVALDIAAFPNGLYWVRVTTNSGAVYLGKVLKQE